MTKLNVNLIYFAPCGRHEGVGGGARVNNLINIFARLGMNIKLLSYIPKDNFKIKHEKLNNSLEIITIYVPKSLPKFLKALFAIPLFLMYGLKYIKRNDIVFAHGPDILSGFLSMILAKMFNKPLVVDHMDIKGPDTPNIIYESVLKNSTIVFAISRYLEEEAKNIGCKNVIYAPIFTDTNVFQMDLSAREKVRNELEIEDNDFLIGYAGSFWYVEGVQYLIKAFKNLFRKHENIRLMVIGGKNVPESDNVPLLIDEFGLMGKVIFIPQQPHESIPKYLSACDILCSPKIDCIENRAANPIKVVEYLSMGLPTVCSAVGGVIDTIEDGVNGFLVKPGDVKELEEKLEWVILNPERSKEIGENGRKKAIEKYSYEAIEDTIREAIREIVDKKKGGIK